MATAPNAVNYGNSLPLGIEAKAQRRLFFPSTGDKYSGDQSSIIRISLNYDGMLDTSLSYLKFDIENNGTKSFLKDLGQPEISRLVVSSGGVVLEDIQNYNQLLGSILVPCQANDGVINEQNNNCNAFGDVTLGVNSADDAKATNVKTYQNGMVPGAYAYGSIVAGEDGRPSTGGNEGSGVIGKDKKRTVCYKLVSGLLDNEKYLPLVLMNNGLDIEIHLENALRMCCIEPGTSAGDLQSYEITNVRYVAHLVDLQRDFYDMLRMTQQQSGGVIQIAGQTFRHFSNALGKTATGSQNFNVPVRARSIKSIFFCAGAQTATKETFDLSSCSAMALSSYQVRIGATSYPPTAILCNQEANKSEPYLEVMKAFGKLGSNIHSNLLGSCNYLTTNILSKASVGAGNLMKFAPYGIDLETFRAEIENGVDTSSRALPMTLSLGINPASSAGADTTDLTLHTFAMIDSLFFINMDGSVSVSA